MHTVFRDPHWADLIEGEDEPASKHAFKSEAVAAGRKLAQRADTEHVIHNRDGTIAYVNTYGPERNG